MTDYAFSRGYRVGALCWKRSRCAMVEPGDERGCRQRVLDVLAETVGGNEQTVGKLLDALPERILTDSEVIFLTPQLTAESQLGANRLRRNSGRMTLFTGESLDRAFDDVTPPQTDAEEDD
jgi:hypothetical protein